MGTKQREIAKIGSNCFIVGRDSISDEYDKWLSAKIVRKLLGPFEVPSEYFDPGNPQNVVNSVGLKGYTVVQYEPSSMWNPCGSPANSLAQDLCQPCETITDESSPPCSCDVMLSAKSVKVTLKLKTGYGY